jgi:hypothetical protein
MVARSLLCEGNGDLGSKSTMCLAHEILVPRNSGHHHSFRYSCADLWFSRNYGAQNFQAQELLYRVL